MFIFARKSVRSCSRSANATPHSDLGQRIASELAWLSLNRTDPVIPYSFSANDYSTAMSSLPIL